MSTVLQQNNNKTFIGQSFGLILIKLSKIGHCRLDVFFKNYLVVHIENSFQRVFTYIYYV